MKHRQDLHEDHRTDADGNPTGGFTRGTGIEIKWQDGPLGRGDERLEPNGAFVEGVIQAAIGRLEFYQTASGGKYACDENGHALYRLREALEELDARTAGREMRGVEGLHQA